MKLFNTLTGKLEDFKPLNPPAVTLYTCGPTVYDYTHLGHIRTFTSNDILKRTLTYLGYNVNHVMNITDVGHLTSDEDAGEDKLEKGAQKTGKTVWQVARFYTDYFIDTLKELNIITADHLVKATGHVTNMINLIETLQKKGFTYETKEAVYFDVAKDSDYGKLTNQKLEDKQKGAREEVYVDAEKKHPADFVLWFKKVGRFANHQMHWPSPWGEGFPGWHIECSAMSMKYLGETIDIHTGGIEHIPVHHENEIAQSESATGKRFVNYWVHFQHLMIDGEKMSKSLGNFYTINDVKKHSIEALALRYLFLQTHYRQPMNFTWESARAAQEAYNKLKESVLSLKTPTTRTSLSNEKLTKVDEYRQRFDEAVANDIQIPQALAVMWEMLKSNIPSTDKLDLLFDFDRVFGLKLNEVTEEKIPEEIKKLAEERLKAKQAKNFPRADELRSIIETKGFIIEDTADNYRIKKI